MHSLVTEETLIRSCQTGDQQAFEQLLNLHEERLLSQATGMCRNPDLAVELAHETFIEAWKSIRRFNFSCRFSTWLFSILRNRYRNAVRRSMRKPTVPLLEEPPVEPAQPSDIDREQLLAQVDQLKEKHRTVIQLRFYADASIEEIATLLGIAPGTVKSRLHYALLALRKKIEKK
jgi:RNA polymerase sigma-70 factor (ECF subfamily)